MGLVEDSKVRNKTSHAVLKADFPLFDQEHDCRRGGDALGQRGKVEDGVRLHGTFLREERAKAVGPLQDDFLSFSHQDHSPRKNPVGNGLLECILNGTKIH